MPLPMNSAANRFGAAAAALCRRQAAIDSSHGRAIVTPTPREEASAATGLESCRS